MTIAFDSTFTENPTTDTWNSSDPHNFNYTPTGTPRGVVVLIGNDSNSDVINGVTYGGVSMTRAQMNVDTTGEPLSSYIYFLGASIPTGTQTVSIDKTGASNTYAVVASFTAAADTEVVDVQGTSNNVTNPSETMVYGGRTCASIGIFCSGLASPASITPNANMTNVHTNDTPAAIAITVDRQTTPGSSNFVFSYTAASDDVALSVVAISEVQAADLPDLVMAPRWPRW